MIQQKTTSKKQFKLHIPINPVPASRPRVGRWGTYYGKTYAAWRKHVEEFFENYLKINSSPNISGPVIVSLAHIVQKPKTSKRTYPRGDIDNYDKAALDAIVKHGILVDDDSVLQLHSFKAFASDEDKQGTSITITRL